jgi:crossover junction endonuclease MUS81
MMILKIDTRERELIKKCEDLLVAVPAFKDLKIVVEPLHLGDIIITTNKSDNENIDNIIVERKSLSDLASSIKDGRYEEQSYRLSGLPHHNHNIVYLIEGDLAKFNSFKERIDKQTLYSAMFSINYYKGFSLMRSTSMDETAFIVCNMAYKIGKDPNKMPYFNQTSINSESELLEPSTSVPSDIEPSVSSNSLSKDYCSVIKKVKKDNITEENIGEIMLCQIPGISSVTALTIMEKYKYLPNLVKCLQEDPECLNGISTTDANGKSRKISKTTIATIVKYLGNKN